MFDSWKKKKATNYLEKEILRLSLGTQELLKKWLMDDLSKYGELSPDKYEEELRKFYPACSRGC